MSFLNQVVEFCKVLGSAVVGPNSAVVYNLTGIGGFRLGEDGTPEGTDESDDGGEQAHEQEAYGALGIIGCPLPPEGDLFAETIAVRREDGLVPAATRDLRINRAVNPGGGSSTPQPGQQMFAGYGGAFLSHSIAPGTSRTNVSTWYVPHDFDGSGVPQKAHAIQMTPGQGISIVHASGLRIDLLDDAGIGPGIVASVDGSTFLRMSAGEVTVQAAKIMLKGNVYLGAAAEAGVPMLGGPITPPSPSVFISPV